MPTAATQERLQVRTAATVVCVRRAAAAAADAAAAAAPLRLAEADPAEAVSTGGGGTIDFTARTRLVFGSSDQVVFSSGWEVLLGQGEVQNWVRSTPDKSEPMRYPGEWKFAGGALDPGEAPEEAARRELQEEFMVQLPKDSSASRLHLLSIMQTRPVRNVSFIVYNFVAVAEENPWLQELDAGEVNAALARRREGHRARVADGSFWALSKAEREAVAPEVREVRWLSMRDAVLNAFTSMNPTLAPVNAFQSEEFDRLGIRRRDPMFVSMLTLLEVESFPSLRSLADHAGGLDPGLELERAQWLEDGMTPEEVAGAWEAKVRQSSARSPMFQSAEDLSTLRTRRLAAAASASAVGQLPPDEQPGGPRRPPPPACSGSGGGDDGNGAADERCAKQQRQA